MIHDASLRAERLAKGAERFRLAHVSDAMDAVERLDAAGEIGQRTRRRLVLEEDDHAHAVTPLRHRAPEVEGEEPEAPERRQGQRDEEDRADAHAAGAPEIDEGFAENEAEHLDLILNMPFGMLTVGETVRVWPLLPRNSRHGPITLRLSSGRPRRGGGCGA